MTASVYTKRYAKFRELLIKYREDKGLTQAALGAKLGRPQSDISKYERGVRRLDVVELLELSELLEFDPCEMLKAIKVIER